MRAVNRDIAAREFLAFRISGLGIFYPYIGTTLLEECPDLSGFR